MGDLIGFRVLGANRGDARVFAGFGHGIVAGVEVFAFLRKLVTGQDGVREDLL